MSTVCPWRRRKSSGEGWCWRLHSSVNVLNNNNKRMDGQRETWGQSCLPFLCILQVTFFHFMFLFGCEREWIMNQNSIFFHHILCVIWLRLYPFIIKISPNSGVGSPATRPGDCTQFSVSIITALLLTAIANGDHKYNSFFFLEYVWKGWYC